MRHIVFLILGLLLFFTLQSFAKVYITVTDAKVKKSHLAISHLKRLGSGALSKNNKQQIRNQIKQDIQFIDLFSIVKDSHFESLEKREHFGSLNYTSWGLKQVGFVLQLGYKISADKTLTLEMALHDVASQTIVLRKRVAGAIKNYYYISQKIVDAVNQSLTGEDSIFGTKIVMACQSPGRLKKKNREIYVINIDGRGLRQLTKDKTLSLSPAWSPDQKNITYTQYAQKVTKKKGKVFRKTNPILRIHNLKSGQRQIVSQRDGMNSGAAWAPDNETIALTMSHSGRPEIYLIHRSGKKKPQPLSRELKLRRLSGIGYQPNYVSLLFDVEPSWSPDGKNIVFSSARSGKPMIYIVNVLSKLATQLTFAGRYNSSPKWSPKGDKIIFSAQHHAKGNFDLYLIDPDGNNLSRLTEGGANGRKKINYENASWAPNSRHFAYTSNESGKYAVYVRTVDGKINRRISPSNLECNDPSWSPNKVTAQPLAITQ